MIDDIRNWLGDLASGKIKDAHIALTEAQLADFRLRLDNLVAENAELLSKISVLETRLAEAILEKDQLKEQLDAAIGDKDRLDKECEDILFLLFDTDRKLTIDQITKHFQIHPSVAKAHFDTLGQKGYVWARAAIVRDFGASRPAEYELTPEGRNYAMKRRKK